MLFPKRTIPGFAFGALFLFVGVGTGFIISVPFDHPKNFQPVHLVFAPAFILALWYVRRLWRSEKSGVVIEMAPQDLAMMLGVFMAIGFVLGILLSLPSVQNG
jgi:lysylphosphatidylglycerol synthetase-like protein (DUF2156 family)